METKNLNTEQNNLENNLENNSKNNSQNNEEIFENEVKNASEKIWKVVLEVHKKIVWQDELIKNLLIWLFWKWHILIEWVPWLAKTLTVDTLSKTLDLWFNRVQFTPDLLPSDLVWTEIYNQKTWEFLIKKWPIFNNFILADEINRAPSKVQSALLEAMAERHITIWNETFGLDKPFIVLATQNPIEQSWTYQLPEAQLDRFMLKVNVDYADKNTEKEMYKKLNSDYENIKINKILDKSEVLKITWIVDKIHVSDAIFDYVSDIVDATRNPEKYWLNEIWEFLTYWISPRWWISLINSAKANALIEWRSFVIPEDIKKVWVSVLTHRLVLSYEAVANEISAEDIVKKIFDKIEIK